MGAFASPMNILKWIRNGIINHEYVQLLSKNAPFRYVFISGIISRIGDFLTNIALGTILEMQTSGTKYNGMALSFLVLTFISPMVLFSNWGGVVADLTDKRFVMLTTDLLRSVIVLLFIFVESSIIPLLIVLFLKESLASFFNSSKEGLIPVTVPDKDLDIANALDALMWMSCSFLGATLGGIIMVVFGSKVSYILNSLTYLLSASCVVLLILAMRKQKPKQLETVESSDSDQVDAVYDNLSPSDDFQANYEDITAELPRKTIPAFEDEDKFAPAIEQSMDNEIPNDWLYRDQKKNSFSDISIYDSPVPEYETEQLSNNMNIENSDDALVEKYTSTPMKVVHQVQNLLFFLFDQIRGFFFGLIFLATNPYLLSIAFVKGFQASVWGPLDILLIIFSNGRYKIADDPSIFLSMIRAAMGLTSGISPILLERIIRPKSALAMRRVVSFSWFLMSVGTITVFVARFFADAGLFFFIIGCSIYAYGAGQVWVYSTIILQKSCPSNYVGRVLAFDMGFSASMLEIILALITGASIDFLHASHDTIILALMIYSFIVTIGWTIHYFIFRKTTETYKPFWLLQSMRFSGLDNEEKLKLELSLQEEDIQSH